MSGQHVSTYSAILRASKETDPRQPNIFKTKIIRFYIIFHSVILVYKVI